MMSSYNDGGRNAEGLVARQKEEYGGIKFGSAFFGWLTATGMVVLLTVLVAGVGSAFGMSMTAAPGLDGQKAGLAGGIAWLVILLVAYYCGGYVAGRMARFNGIKQGIAVWLWAIVIDIVVAIIAAIVGQRLLSRLSSFPSIPVNETTLNSMSIIAAIALAVSSLIGAILGGLVGMRFHRRVDRMSLEGH